MPSCLGRSGSVRAMRMAHRARWALDVHTFCPLTIQSPEPSSRTARVASAARSEPAAGLAEQLAPHLLADPQRPQEALLLFPGAEAQDGRRGHAEADTDPARVVVGGASGDEFGVHDGLERARRVESAEPRRVVHPGESGVEAGLEERGAVGATHGWSASNFLVSERSSAASVIRRPLAGGRRPVRWWCRRLPAGRRPRRPSSAPAH